MELVVELDAHRTVALGDDDRSQVVGGTASDRIHARGTGLDVAAQLGCLGQVHVQLLGVVDQVDAVVVGAEVGSPIRHSHGNVVAEVVGLTRTKTGQRVHELLEGISVRVVRNEAVHVMGRALGVHGPERSRGKSPFLGGLVVRDRTGGLDGGLDFSLGGSQRSFASRAVTLCSGLAGLHHGATTDGTLDDGVLIATYRGCGCASLRLLGHGVFGIEADSREQGCGERQQTVELLKHEAPRL